MKKTILIAALLFASVSRADTDSDARAIILIQLAIANQKPDAKPLSIDDLPPLKFKIDLEPKADAPPEATPVVPLTVPADHHYHYAGCCGVYFAHDGKAGSSHVCPICGRGNWTTIVQKPARGTTVYLNPVREVKQQRPVDNCPE